MKAKTIRQVFIDTFFNQQHVVLPSSSLIPTDDPTLLFTNSGMVQFKDQFINKFHPPNKRVVTAQKCLRAGGKHNDLENVGFTARHHTFFEMLGNFSFGDYFKSEAIQMAWSFLTKTLMIPPPKLYVTVHRDDPETANLWHKQEGVPKDHIFFRGDKDNFWEMGEVGPCGPSSEIFFDHGPEFKNNSLQKTDCILDDEDRYVEIWNLVFMQYERYHENNTIKQRPLLNLCVDTGCGLERLSAVMQGVYNNFDTDLFTDIIKQIETYSKTNYTQHPQWFRVVADHVRASTMLLNDGVLPSNEGRGYVLRRIIRRAVRYLDLLQIKEPTLFQFAPTVFQSLESILSSNEITQHNNMDFIQKYLKLEEESFRKTLHSGVTLLQKKIELLKSNNQKTLSGEDAFFLYDTHGFPSDLTQMILKEYNLNMNEDTFNQELQKQKERSKKAGHFISKEDNLKAFYSLQEKEGYSKFCGNENLSLEAKLLGIVELPNQNPDIKEKALIFNKTPFYPESGGQVGDKGEIFKKNKLLAQILDTQKPIDGIITHKTNSSHPFKIGKIYTLKVDSSIRKPTMSNHTATHLLQAALIQILGNHIKQAGSSVGPSQLRFDFTHPEALTKQQITTIENLVNNQIQKHIEVITKHMTKTKALSLGAMSLFGEKYGNEVRVIDIPSFSIELCGGTHVKNTKDIQFFKILTESSLATGVRRIEAVTANAAYSYIDKKLQTLNQIEALLNTKDKQLLNKILKLKDNQKDLQKEIKSLKDKLQSINAQSLFENTTALKNQLIFKYIEAAPSDDLKTIGDLFMDKFQNGIVLISKNQEASKMQVLLKTTKKNPPINCSTILKETLNSFGGKGGGRPDMAQGTLESNKKDLFVKSISDKIELFVHN